MTSQLNLLSRREFLLLALAGMSVACAPGEQIAINTRINSMAAREDWLPLIIGDPAASARLGSVYLQHHPDYRQGSKLVEDILRSLVANDKASAQTSDPLALAGALKRLVQQEYARSDVASINGWVLSTTEARLYALAALAN